jgi:hypothetical protein
MTSRGPLFRHGPDRLPIGQRGDQLFGRALYDLRQDQLDARRPSARIRLDGSRNAVDIYLRCLVVAL